MIVGPITNSGLNKWHLHGLAMRHWLNKWQLLLERHVDKWHLTRNVIIGPFMTHGLNKWHHLGLVTIRLNKWHLIKEHSVDMCLGFFRPLWLKQVSGLGPLGTQFIRAVSLRPLYGSRGLCQRLSAPNWYPSLAGRPGRRGEAAGRH